MSDTYIEMASAGFGPSLREGEKIEMAGMAMVPPSGCLSLLFGNVMAAAQTYLTILTTQRLVFARTSSLAGKYTPKTIQVKRENRVYGGPYGGDSQEQVGSRYRQW